MAVAVIGLAVVMISVLLPWGDNEITGTASVTSVADRHPEVLIIVVVGLVLQAMAVFGLRRRTSLAVLAAALGAGAIMISAVLFPRGDVFWDGADSQGNSIGGAEPTVVGIGAVTAVMGSLIVLTAAVWAARGARKAATDVTGP